MNKFEALTDLCNTVQKLTKDAGKTFLKAQAAKNTIMWRGFTFKVSEVDTSAGYPSFEIDAWVGAELAENFAASVFVMYDDSTNYYWEI